jgi:hypothetical protein
MKKIFFISITTFSLLMSSCKKDEIISTDTNVGHSTITYFVDLSLKGSASMVITKGGIFTDPGAIATENGKNVTITVDGSVDASTPGIYQLTYSAKNKDGFSKSVSRIVAVTPGGEVPGTDMSGKYAGIAPLIANVTKIGDGIYYMDNCNHPLTAFGGYFVCLDGLAITFYNQPTGLGEMSGSGSYDPVTKKAVWKLSIPSQSYTRTRTFTRL